MGEAGPELWVCVKKGNAAAEDGPGAGTVSLGEIGWTVEYVCACLRVGGVRYFHVVDSTGSKVHVLFDMAALDTIIQLATGGNFDNNASFCSLIAVEGHLTTSPVKEVRNIRVPVVVLDHFVNERWAAIVGKMKCWGIVVGNSDAIDEKGCFEV